MAVDDSYTKSLLHFNGADASTTFTDESGKVWSVYSAGSWPQIRTADKKFGSASGYFNGDFGSGWIYSSAHADWILAANDFTFDFQLHPNFPSDFFVWGQVVDSNNYNLIRKNGAAIQFIVKRAGTNVFSGKFTITDTDWIHVAVVRNGSNLYGFCDGVVQSWTLYTASLGSQNITELAGDVYIGGNGYVFSPITGYLDEFRFSNIARWITGFTPPTEEYGPPPSVLAATASSSDFFDTTMDIIDEQAISSDLFDSTMEDMAEQVSASDSFDTASSTVQATATDTLGFTDTPAYIVTLPKTLTDTIFIYDTPGVGWKISVTDALILADTIDKTLGILIEDWITLVDSETNRWTGSEIISDEVNLYDVLVAGFMQTASITESLVLTDSTALKLTITVLEYLGFTDLATAMKTMAQSVSDSVDLTDSAQWAWPQAITEALTLIDATSVMATFLRSVSDSVAFADVPSVIKQLGLSINESLVLSETLSVQGTLYAAVYDTLAMNVTVELDGEYYETYVLNTPKFLPSMYSGFDFNSYCVYQGRAFGANATGIFELTGDTDAGATIRTGVVLHETDFDSPNQKRFRRAYLDISGTAPKMIVETEDGKRRVYDIDTKGKTVISHEMKGKYWTLSISDFQEIESVRLIPVVLSK